MATDSPRKSPHAGVVGWLTAAALVLACVLVYWGSLRTPMFFDDHDSIETNRSVHSLWPLSRSLNPPAQNPLTARPLPSLSFAVNYELGGLQPRGYHAVNIALHALCALLVWRLVHLALRSPALPERWRGAADGLSLAVAAVWALHPLQSEAVAYITQRTELMMAFFYLLTLWCAAMSWREQTRPGSKTAWRIAAVVACAMGMASKEVMVSAPIAVLLYDRAFVSGTLIAAWRKSRLFYLALGCTWAVLPLLAWAGGGRGQSVGTHLGATRLDWLQTQAGVILWYLHLSFWPSPLQVNYDWPIVHSFGAAAGPFLAVALLCAGSFWLALRGREWAWLGFVGACFFLVLGPTSSVLPIPSEVIAERRMYLPLLCVVTPMIVLIYAMAIRVAGPRGAAIAWAMFAVTAATLAWGSVHRIHDYASEEVIWQNVLKHQPRNSYALNGLGVVRFRAHRLEEADRLFRGAIEANAMNFRPYVNLGNTLQQQGAFSEAMPYLQKGAELNPDDAETCNSLANCRYKLGNLAGAAEGYMRALQLDPDLVSANVNFGTLLTATGQFAEARAVLSHALELDPENGIANGRLGTVLASMGDPTGALSHMSEAARLQPDSAELRFNLGVLLAQSGKRSEGRASMEAALQLAERSNQRELIDRIKQTMATLDSPH